MLAGFIRSRQSYVLAVISGLVLSFALLKPGTWLVAWIGLVPLLVALREARPARAALCGFIAGIVYYGIILYWITLFGFLPWVLLAAYQALYFAVFAVLSAYFLSERRGWRAFIAIPAAWVALQYVRTLGTYAFIWGSFAHTQADNTAVAQIASVTGPWGIDFLVCLANLSLAQALMPGRRRYAALVTTAAITAGVAVYGVIAMRPGVAVRIAPIAIIQGNMKNDFNPVPNYDRLSYERYSKMTAEAAKSGVELIIWPETTIPSDITSPGWADSLAANARKAQAQLLVGGYDSSRDPNLRGSYNAVFLYSENGRKLGTYRKVQLVPFGEFVPLRNRLPMLQNYGIRSEDVLAARSHALLDSRIGKIGVSICFESLFPEIARGETLRGANVLCVVTNDAWFQRTQAAREHLLMAKLRAIENRRCVMRAAGTGISTVIDPFGRTSREIGLFRRGILQAAVQPRKDLTLYTRLGQWFAYLCLIVLALAFAAPRAASV